MTSNPLRNHSDFEFNFPHKPDCFVYRYAQMLIGADRCGRCTCGAESKCQDLERALIELMSAVDDRGLKICLGGNFENVDANFRCFLRMFVERQPVEPINVPAYRINALRNLEMLTRVYRLMFEGMPQHAGSCSNQNPLDSLGAWRGASSCACNRLYQDDQGRYHTLEKS